LEICFTGLWWELVVAQTVRSWKMKYEMKMGVEIFSNSDQSETKNELDIVLNSGKNMVFIECKSGLVKQEDINKMRAIKRVYGGISTRSILVCRKLPRKAILEKCNELDVDVFALQRMRKGSQSRGYIPLTDLSQLNARLTKLIDQMQL